MKKELLTRGVVEIIEKESLIKKLKSGKRLKIKHGIDPTSPIIHLGNAVVLQKLKEFQNLGHQVILIIGDFTAQIGDPSDKEAMRQPLSRKEINKNMKTYKSQIGRILNLKKTKFFYNSQWLSKINLKEIILKLASQFTVAQILERENFFKRYQEKKPIGLHEFFYPLMQGYDSVVVRADVEIGGTDQKFNMLAGREIQRAYNQKPQDIITMKLLEGVDGRKMSKSYGNIIGIYDKPNEIYGKIMSIRDELISDYFELSTKIPLKEIEEIKTKIKNQKINPKEVKSKLAFEIVSMYYNKKLAQQAAMEFERVFKEKKLPLEIPEVKIKEKEINILDLLVKANLVSSKSEGRRLILQKGLRIDGEKENDWKKMIQIKKEMVLQAGKRKFKKIIPAGPFDE